MSSTNIKVLFEGPAAKAGTIDARLLAESLLGYDEPFVRANSLVNGDASIAAVMLQSEFRSGSFIAGLDFVQNITEQAAKLITGHQFQDARALAGLIGFLPSDLTREVLKEFTKETVIGLFRWLKGKSRTK